MATLVGKQDKLVDALQSLLELEHDAMEAYKLAINKIKNEGYKTKLETFFEDHKRHISELTSALQKHDAKVKLGSDMKVWLTKGKTFMANLMGDDAILRAMFSNEQDTNRAYENMNDRKDIWADLVDVLKHALEDERSHKEWLKDTIND